jgi:ferredoxin/flavodoxin---NADP+ reductase
MKKGLPQREEWFRQPELIQVRVLRNKELSPSVFLTEFEKKFSFVPGQVLSVTTDPGIPARMYSLSSGSMEYHCSILYDRKEEGLLTPSLSILIPGDQVYVSKPFGSFIHPGEPSIWIATGTGIAPFASMILSGIGKDSILFHGSRTIAAFHFADLFSSILRKNYFRCCSTQAGDGISQGRVTDFLKEKKDLPLDRFYYLCGSAEMVVDVRQILMDKGVAFNRIMAEIYF